MSTDNYVTILHTIKISVASLTLGQANAKSLQVEMIITSEYVTEMPFIPMKIRSHQLLPRWLLRHILQFTIP